MHIVILNYHISSEGVLTKHFLKQIVKSKNEYEQFLSDGVKLENLTKDFLFSVIEHLDPQTFRDVLPL